MLAQSLIDFLKHGARNGAGFGERFAHANGLAALSGENKCAHDCSCSSVFWQFAYGAALHVASPNGTMRLSES